MNSFQADEELNHVGLQSQIEQFNYVHWESELEYPSNSKFKTSKNSTQSITKELESLRLRTAISKRIKRLKVLNNYKKKMTLAAQKQAQYTFMMYDDAPIEVGNLYNTHY